MGLLADIISVACAGKHQRQAREDFYKHQAEVKEERNTIGNRVPDAMNNEINMALAGELNLDALKKNLLASGMPEWKINQKIKNIYNSHFG